MQLEFIFAKDALSWSSIPLVIAVLLKLVPTVCSLVSYSDEPRLDRRATISAGYFWSLPSPTSLCLVEAALSDTLTSWLNSPI